MASWIPAFEGMALKAARTKKATKNHKYIAEVTEDSEVLLKELN